MKKPFVAPKITEIELLPEEGILSYCRGTGSLSRSGRCQTAGGSCANRTQNTAGPS